MGIVGGMVGNGLVYLFIRSSMSSTKSCGWEKGGPGKASLGLWIEYLSSILSSGIVDLQFFV